MSSCHHRLGVWAQGRGGWVPNEGAPGPWLRDQLRAHSRPQAGGGVSNVHAFSHQAGVCRWRLQLSSWLGSRFRGPGSISLILTWGSEQVGQLLSPPPSPPSPTKSPVSGREGFLAGLGHCSFWVIGRPTAVCLELERRSKQSSPLLPWGRDWGAGEEDGFASHQGV